MRELVVIGLIAIGLGTLVGATIGFVYGIGVAMLVGGVISGVYYLTIFARRN